MNLLRYGIVGAGFVGPHHVEAVRRLGFVEIAAMADANLDLARPKTKQLLCPREFPTVEAG